MSGLQCILRLALTMLLVGAVFATAGKKGSKPRALGTHMILGALIGAGVAWAADSLGHLDSQFHMGWPMSILGVMAIIMWLFTEYMLPYSDPESGDNEAERRTARKINLLRHLTAPMMWGVICVSIPQTYASISRLLS